MDRYKKEWLKYGSLCQIIAPSGLNLPLCMIETKLINFSALLQKNSKT